jgi:hypothetical protein
MCHTAQTDQGLRVYTTAKSVYLVCLHVGPIAKSARGFRVGSAISGCGEGNHGTRRGREELDDLGVELVKEVGLRRGQPWYKERSRRA